MLMTVLIRTVLWCIGNPHIFHSNSRRVFKYLSRFTEWRVYAHRVLANIDGTTYPFPINRSTTNKFYNRRKNGVNISPFYLQG